MVEFAPVIGLAIALLVLLRVFIWQRRRDERRRRQRR
jgi:Flp pilus assembly protein TadB